MDILVNFTQQGIEDLKKDVTQTSDEFETLAKTVDLAKKKLSTLDEGSKEFKTLNNEIKAVEKTMKSVTTTTEKSTTRMRALKEELVVLRTEMDRMAKAGEKNTQAFKNLSAQFDKTKADAAELRDNIADIGDEINASASDTNKLDRAIRGLSLGVSTFGALEGAAVLFGGESEKVQQVLTRLNAVMLITNSLQQISTELTRKDAVTKGLAATATRYYAIAVGTGTKAMKLFRIALVSIGIGAFVIAISALIANFDKVKEAVTNALPGLDNFGKKVRNAYFAVTDFLRLTSEVKRDAKKEAKQGELELQGFIERKEREFQILQKQGKDTLKVEEEILLARIKLIQKYGDTTSKEYRDALFNLELFRTDSANVADVITNTINEKLKKGVKVGETFTKAVKETLIKSTPSILESLRTALESAEDDLSISIQYKTDPALIKAFADDVLRLRSEINGIETAIEEALNFAGTAVELKPLEEGVQLVQKFSGEIKKAGLVIKEASIGEKVRGFLGLGKAEDYSGVVSNVLNVYSQIANIALQTSALISQAAKQRADAEITNLERARQSGLISEQKYLTKVREIQNQQAKRQRRADIINAAVQIPISILSAFSNTNGGIIAKLAAAAIAGAFASAQVALIAKAKIPTYGEGGEVAGKLHKHGGTLIEAEKGEFIVKRKNAAKYKNMYGKSPLDLLNNGMFENYFQPKTTNVNTVDNKGVIDELRFIASYIRNGNNLTVIGNQRLIDAMSSKYRT
jgi:uncharacterized protein YukE